jgi:hypothetical protein
MDAGEDYLFVSSTDKARYLRDDVVERPAPLAASGQRDDTIGTGSITSILNFDESPSISLKPGYSVPPVVVRRAVLIWRCAALTAIVHPTNQTKKSAFLIVAENKIDSRDVSEGIRGYLDRTARSDHAAVMAATESLVNGLTRTPIAFGCHGAGVDDGDICFCRKRNYDVTIDFKLLTNGFRLILIQFAPDSVKSGGRHC